MFIICLSFLSIYTSSSIAAAQTYKCTKNGTTAYSQLPCSEGISTPANIPTGKIPSADYQAALKRNRSDANLLKKLEDTRHKEEEKREKEMKTISAKNKQTERKCAELRKIEKWAKDDLDNAKPKEEIKARLKFKRAAEKTTLHCKEH